MEKIEKLKKIFKREKIDGYIIPKNDNFFNENIPDHNDRLNFISGFTGSNGFALILKSKNYLFVDGRYTLQANNQSGKSFKILTIPDEMPVNVLKRKKLTIGFDPTLYTKKSLSIFFKKSKCKLKPLINNLIDEIWMRKTNSKKIRTTRRKTKEETEKIKNKKNKKTKKKNKKSSCHLMIGLRR